jgi:hypothetical protein
MSFVSPYSFLFFSFGYSIRTIRGKDGKSTTGYTRRKSNISCNFWLRGKISTLTKWTKASTIKRMDFFRPFLHFSFYPPGSGTEYIFVLRSDDSIPYSCTMKDSIVLSEAMRSILTDYVRGYMNTALNRLSMVTSEEVDANHK